MSALRATGVHVTRARRTVITGLDLEVGAGEVVAVLGPNGAGKSTLVSALAGIVPLAAGTVDVTGRRATLMQAPGLARRSVRANVQLALAWWGVPRRARGPRADAALTGMRADHLARRPAAQLSGGERRRVHLARALALGADVLLLDEPFDGLDPETHAALRDDTTEALRSTGGAVVVVLHDRRDAWAMADRAVVLIDGTIRADGPPRALLSRPPSPEVARFLGYDGELAVGDQLLLTRAGGVVVDPQGDVVGRVTRVVGTEDGARVRVETGTGSLWATDDGRTRVGDQVRLRVVDSVTFPRSARPVDPAT